MIHGDQENGLGIRYTVEAPDPLRPLPDSVHCGKIYCTDVLH